MRQIDEDLDHPALRRDLLVSPEAHEHTGTGDLSDRQAVIAVMVANGLTCEDIALRLFLFVRVVEGHLQQALKILGLSHVEDLSYVLVASHYNRNSPTARAHITA